MAQELMTPTLFDQHVARIAATLTEPHTLGELKETDNRAGALLDLAARAKISLKAINQLVVEWLRLQRRMGDLIRDMPKNEGGDPRDGATGDPRKAGVDGSASDPLPPGEGVPKTLKELGISYNQSSRYQKIANIPADDFEEYCALADTATDDQDYDTPFIRPIQLSRSNLVDWWQVRKDERAYAASREKAANAGINDALGLGSPGALWVWRHSSEEDNSGRALSEIAALTAVYKVLKDENEDPMPIDEMPETVEGLRKFIGDFCDSAGEEWDVSPLNEAPPEPPPDTPLSEPIKMPKTERTDRKTETARRQAKAAVNTMLHANTGATERVAAADAISRLVPPETRDALHEAFVEIIENPTAHRYASNRNDLALRVSAQSAEYHREVVRLKKIVEPLQKRYKETREANRKLIAENAQACETNADLIDKYWRLQAEIAELRELVLIANNVPGGFAALIPVHHRVEAMEARTAAGTYGIDPPKASNASNEGTQAVPWFWSDIEGEQEIEGFAHTQEAAERALFAHRGTPYPDTPEKVNEVLDSWGDSWWVGEADNREREGVLERARAALSQTTRAPVSEARETAAPGQ